MWCVRPVHAPCWMPGGGADHSAAQGPQDVLWPAQLQTWPIRPRETSLLFPAILGGSSRLHRYDQIPTRPLLRVELGWRLYVAGQRFAMMELKTMLCAVLWRYRVHPVTSLEGVKLRWKLTLNTETPLLFRLEHRNKDLGNNNDPDNVPA